MEKELISKFVDKGIDEDMAASLAGYVVRGLPVGDFLYNVLSNNLVGSFHRADDRNVTKLFNYANIIYNDIPLTAWGSEEIVEKWMEQGGLYGIK